MRDGKRVAMSTRTSLDEAMPASSAKWRSRPSGSYLLYIASLPTPLVHGPKEGVLLLEGTAML